MSKFEAHEAARKAACNNDPESIKEFIKNYPGLINQPCPVENPHKLQNGLISLTRQTIGGIVALAGSVLLPPAIPGFLAAYLYNAYQALKEERNKNRSRVHWTLLDYAGESGALEVAILLILNGAKTGNGHFLELAESNGHHKFIESCNSIMKKYAENKAEILRLRNDITMATTLQETTEDAKIFLGLKKISKEEKLNQLWIGITDLHRFYQEERSSNNSELEGTYEEKISSNDSKSEDKNIIDIQSLDKMHKMLKKMHKKILKKGDTLNFVYAMCEHKNPRIKEYAIKLSDKLYERFEPEFLEMAEQYKGLYNDYVTSITPSTQGNFTPTSTSPNCSASSATPAFFAAKPDYPLGMKDKKVSYTPNDCFLDAARACFPSRQWTKQQLRKDISQELLNNKNRYKEFFLVENDDEITCEDYDTYCKEIKKDGISVEEWDIAAFCHSQKIACVIVTQETRTFTLYGNEYISDKNPPIFLGFENSNHYVALALPHGIDWKAIFEQIPGFKQFADKELCLNDSPTIRQ
jgi:hypothetical protein